MTRLLHTSVLFRAITALVVCHGHVPKTNKFDYVFGKAPEKPRVPSMVQVREKIKLCKCLRLVGF